MLKTMRRIAAKAVDLSSTWLQERRPNLASPFFTPRERRIWLALARTAIPAGRVVPAPDDATLSRLERQFSAFAPAARRSLRTALWTLELWPLPRRRKPFSQLSGADRGALLDAFYEGSVPRRTLLRALLAPLKLVHFDDPAIFSALSCRYAVETPTEAEPARWKQNLIPLDEQEADLDLQADVVVVGTGAGGAVMAKELAERGLAVAMVEAGDLFDRRQFDGRPLKAMNRMYRGGGAVFTVGRPPILIPAGKTVGGSTTINSGTCLRVPDRVLHKWRREFGLKEFTPDALAPYFERVEAILGVEPAQREYLGGCARVIKRGCETLGYRNHGPLPRNAPDCDGQGVCVFGCPTDAKRSTNVSYVPLALQQHATLFYRARAKRIMIEKGRARGVVAEARIGDGSGQTRRLTLRSRAVVIACGTYATPVLLLRNGLANSSGQLGRNLTLHPAAGVVAEFDEVIDGWDAIPQGYEISEFRDQRMMFEGGFTPLDATTSAFAFFGPAFTQVMERFNHLAMFGFMVEDSSHGRVRLGPGDRPVVLYNLNRADLGVMHKGIGILSEIFFGAGADTVYPPVHGHERLEGLPDLERLRRARLRAMDLSLSAYHPLGTARMGTSPRSSVVGVDHEAHDVPDLYVVDGSSVPSSLGVNPQVTIMAMATRAAEKLAHRLE